MPSIKIINVFLSSLKYNHDQRLPGSEKYDLGSDFFTLPVNFKKPIIVTFSNNKPKTQIADIWLCK